MGNAVSLQPRSDPEVTESKYAKQLAGLSISTVRRWRRKFEECIATMEKLLFVGAVWAEGERDAPYFVAAFKVFSVQITELAVISRGFLNELEIYQNVLTELAVLQSDLHEAVKRNSNAHRRILIMQNGRRLQKSTILPEEIVANQVEVAPAAELKFLKSEFEEAQRAVSSAAERFGLAKANLLPAALSDMLRVYGTMWICAADLFDRLRVVGSDLRSSFSVPSSLPCGNAALARSIEMDTASRRRRLGLLKKWIRIAERTVSLWKETRSSERTHCNSALEWLKILKPPLSSPQLHSTSYLMILSSWYEVLNRNDMQTICTLLSGFPNLLNQIAKREAEVISHIDDSDPRTAFQTPLSRYLFQLFDIRQLRSKRNTVAPISTDVSCYELVMTNTSKKQLYKLEAARHRLEATLLDNRAFRRRRLTHIHQELFSNFAIWAADIGMQYKHADNANNRSPPAYQMTSKREGKANDIPLNQISRVSPANSRESDNAQTPTAPPLTAFTATEARRLPPPPPREKIAVGVSLLEKELLALSPAPYLLCAAAKAEGAIFPCPPSTEKKEKRQFRRIINPNIVS